MKRVVVFIMLLVGLIAGAALQVKACLSLTHERNALAHEVETYYQEEAAKAAHLSIRLARPYLTEEDYGRYSQRLEMLDQYYSRTRLPFDLPEDSYLNVMARLGFDEFELWAMRQLQVGVWPAPIVDSAVQTTLIEQTPRAVIIDMHQPLQSIVFLQLFFNDDDFDDMEDVKKARADFEREKQLFKEAIANARKWPPRRLIYVSKGDDASFDLRPAADWSGRWFHTNHAPLLLCIKLWCPEAVVHGTHSVHFLQIALSFCEPRGIDRTRLAPSVIAYGQLA